MHTLMGEGAKGSDNAEHFWNGSEGFAKTLSPSCVLALKRRFALREIHRQEQ
jgi:hypothetical protein